MNYRDRAVSGRRAILASLGTIALIFGAWALFLAVPSPLTAVLVLASWVAIAVPVLRVFIAIMRGD